MKYIPKHEKKSKLKGRILMGITYTMLAVFFLSACAIDSESNIPMILCLLSVGWLGLFTLANFGEE